MSFLESVIKIYFLTFVTILPLTFILGTICFFANIKKLVSSNEKLGVKSKIIISLNIIISFIFFAGCSLFVLGYDKIITIINSNIYYFVCFLLVVFTYIIISYIESLAINPPKYMKKMSSNLKLCDYKDFIIKNFITQVAKIYIFICYLVAIVLFHLENMDIYIIEDMFIKTIVNVCQNSITLILAFELLINYKKQKTKEINGIKKGSMLFNTFFEFSMKYFDVYNWFTDNFVPVLYQKDNVFYSKIQTLNQSIIEKLDNIRKETDYIIIKESSKIKTYDIAFDTLIECVNNYLQSKDKTDDKKSYIVYMIMYFQEIIKKEIRIKTKKHYLQKVCDFANNYNKKLNRRNSDK